EEAFKTLGEAVGRRRQKLDQAPQDAHNRRALAKHYLFLAHLEREAGRLEESAAAVQKQVDLWPKDADELFAGARGFAQTAAAAGKAAKPSDADRYADRAVAVLRRAVAAGFRSAAQARSDAAFAVLRPREDFRKLVAEMDKAAGSNEDGAGR